MTSLVFKREPTYAVHVVLGSHTGVLNTFMSGYFASSGYPLYISREIPPVCLQGNTLLWEFICQSLIFCAL